MCDECEYCEPKFDNTDGNYTDWVVAVRSRLSVALIGRDASIVVVICRPSVCMECSRQFKSSAILFSKLQLGRIGGREWKALPPKNAETTRRLVSISRFHDDFVFSLFAVNKLFTFSRELVSRALSCFSPLRAT